MALQLPAHTLPPRLHGEEAPGAREVVPGHPEEGRSSLSLCFLESAQAPAGPRLLSRHRDTSSPGARPSALSILGARD